MHILRLVLFTADRKINFKLIKNHFYRYAFFVWNDRMRKLFTHLWIGALGIRGIKVRTMPESLRDILSVVTWAMITNLLNEWNAVPIFSYVTVLYVTSLPTSNFIKQIYDCRTILTDAIWNHLTRDCDSKENITLSQFTDRFI